MPRILIIALSLAATAALAAPAMAATKTVNVGDDFFVKKGKAPTVTVARNTTVKWVWKGKNPHDVDVTKGPAEFHSKVMSAGRYSKKVTRKGTYSIICNIHAPSMRMTLKVT